jgi:hypothetical protein
VITFVSYAMFHLAILQMAQSATTFIKRVL